jgi:hypothetical protein
MTPEDIETDHDPRKAETRTAPITLTLLPEQCEMLAQALADAVYYRDPPLYCRACEAQDTLCKECAATFVRASAYLTLGRALGVAEPSETRDWPTPR